MLGQPHKVMKVLIPEKMIEEHFIGTISGRYFAESGVFNIFADEMLEAGIECEEIGLISDESIFEEKKLVGNWQDSVLHFSYANEEYVIEKYNLVQNVFSRNTGILESKIMSDKIAIILGCGSVGSLVALELARAGVGNFVLIDNDILEYHNLCRHQCDILEVGNYKVNALYKRIKCINPKANVKSIISTVETVGKEIFDEFCVTNRSILVGCADNRSADVYSNGIAAMYHVPFISIGFWERAFAGEIFYYLPNSAMPCYKCALGEGENDLQRVSTNRRIYTNEEDLAKVNFEPGISVDINFVTTIGIKLILDIINIDNNNFTPRLLETLQQYTLVCNTNNPKIGGEMAEIFSYPLQVTTSLKVEFGGGCPPCEYN